MDLAKLAELKDILLNTKDFAKVWTFFLDHFGEKREFIQLGERVQHSLLESVINQVCYQVLHKRIDVTQVLLNEVKGEGFVHGSGMFEGALVGVLYFEDVEVGMVTICNPFQDSNNHFARFSAKQMRAIPSPSMN